MTNTLIINKLEEEINALKSELEICKAAFLNIVGKNRDGILIFDNLGTIIYANPAAIDLFGQDLGSLLGENIGIFLDSDEITEITIVHRSRGLITVGVNIADTSWNNLPAKLASLRDITIQKKSENELKRISSHDKLTNLYNRASFETALKNEIIRSHQDNTEFALLLLDLDNFKTVNDTFGHDVGDQLLIAVAKKLQQNVRASDVVARLGGDEFVILLSGINGIKDVDDFAQKLIQRFNIPFKLEHHSFHSTLSVGIAVSSLLDHNKNAEEILKNADIALYAVKELGRNNYMFFSEKINDAFNQRSDLETCLPSAISNNEFYLVYQPQYTIPQKKIIGMEVLLRWKHPKLGLIAPNYFIPTAEKNGLIASIDEWVLKTACKQYTEWLNSGIIPHDLKFSINLSPKHLTKNKFLPFLLHLLKTSGMPPQNLELEFKEQSILENAMDLSPIFEELQNIGIKISVDNFGMEYLALTRLKDWPISTLKINKSLIDNLSNDPNDAIIVESIIKLGANLGLNVIPEGVETEEQLKFLLQYNCSTAQGFYFEDHPLSANEMSNLLQKSFARTTQES